MPSNYYEQLHFLTFSKTTTTTSHYTESDHLLPHFQPQYKPALSSLASKSCSTGWLSIWFLFIFSAPKKLGSIISSLVPLQFYWEKLDHHSVDLALSQSWPVWLVGRMLSPSQAAPFWVGVGRKGNHNMSMYILTLKSIWTIYLASHHKGQMKGLLNCLEVRPFIYTFVL